MLVALLVVPFIITFAMKPVLYNPDSQPIQKGEELVGLQHLPFVYEQDTIALHKGKKLLCFFLTNCTTCKQSGLKLQAIADDYKGELPIFIVLMGKMSQVDVFVEKSKIETLPHQFFHKSDTLLSVVGNKYPVMYLVNDGYVYKTLTYSTIDKDEIIRFLTSD